MLRENGEEQKEQLQTKMSPGWSSQITQQNNTGLQTTPPNWAEIENDMDPADGTVSKLVQVSDDNVRRLIQWSQCPTFRQ